MYYNPEVLQPLSVERKGSPVNDVNQAFDFKPEELELADVPAGPIPPAEPDIRVPTGVRSITLTVSGVTVRIELETT